MSASSSSRLDRLLWLDADGSTRLFGLLRVAFVLIAWSTWSTPFILHFDMRPLRLLLAGGYYLGTTLLLVGLWTRVSAPLVAAVLVAASLLLGQGQPDSIWLAGHRQLVVLLAVLVALAPSGRSLSVDRLLALRRGGAAPSDERGPLWVLRLAQLCLSLLLLATILGQLSPSWLAGEPFQDQSLGRWVGLALLAVNGLGLVGPWFRRTRTISLVLVGATWLTLSAFMVTDTIGLSVTWLLACFLPTGSVHRVLDRLHDSDTPRAVDP